ncbi:MAG TPA: nuclear transport factor 2 family protein [Steroidobacteraceae bacterium]|nr:nuclear transport factor 2 family protein [Steroidobacteraceae bacterium]
MRAAFAAILIGFPILMGANPALAAEPMALKDASAVFNQWIAAFQAHDAEKIMTVFDKSLIYSAQGDADLTYAELKKSYQEFFAIKSPPTKWKVIPKEIHTQAGLAVVVSIWEQRQKAGSGPDELVARLRSIDVFKLTKAGWKIVRTINYSEPN